LPDRACFGGRKFAGHGEVLGVAGVTFRRLPFGVHRIGQCVFVPELNHVALAVRDPRRSLHFYSHTIGVEVAVREEEYGFVLTTPRGVVVTLFQGFPTTDHGEFHIGVSLPDGDAVRAQRAVLRSLGVPELEWSDEPGYVSVKVRDPDGYTVEMAWDEKYETTSLPIGCRAAAPERASVRRFSERASTPRRRGGRGRSSRRVAHRPLALLEEWGSSRCRIVRAD
jgi:catechol 2,3-dioxygenase-like lactoylglutathione lyase family enzyme